MILNVPSYWVELLLDIPTQRNMKSCHIYAEQNKSVLPFNRLFSCYSCFRGLLIKPINFFGLKTEICWNDVVSAIIIWTPMNA